MKVENILIIEDKEDIRTWVSELLEQGYPESRIHCEKNLHDALDAIRMSVFQIALVDLGLPDGSGIQAIQEIRKVQENCLSIVFTIFDDSENLFSALKAGAYGYLLKDDEGEDLIKALNGIIEGKPPISPRIAQMMIEHFHQVQNVSESILTKRETEVLTFIAKGFSVKKTAELLEISRYTASDHIKNIYRKLNISSRAEATLKAIDLGIISS